MNDPIEEATLDTSVVRKSLPELTKLMQGKRRAVKITHIFTPMLVLLPYELYQELTGASQHQSEFEKEVQEHITKKG